MGDLKYNIDFWKSFDRSKVTTKNSTFAEFCLPYMKQGESVLDICSGNGRDSIFFKENNFFVSSFDYETLDLKDRKPKFSLDKTFNNIYCRFVLHCIPEGLEDYVLINSHSVLNVGGLLYIEARSDKGEVSNTINQHYRRLIDKEVLKKKLHYRQILI